MNTITQSIRRLVRVLCPFLLLFLSFTAVAQTKGITLNLNDVPLKEALGKIEKDYGFVFLYNEKEITLDKNVNCTFRNADIGTVMSKILGADYSFKVKNRQIVILPNHAGTSQGKQSTDVSVQKKRQISGTVTDANGEPLAGVGVFEKGTTNGTVTDESGRYSIMTAGEGVLVFNSLGFDSQERKLSGSNVVDVILSETPLTLSDVVVVGYGKQRKESVTGAIATISKDDLVQTPQANLSNMLVGRMPGLVATQRSGAPGEDFSNLLIRGVSTFTENSEPLIMVDGVERSNFNGIDPNEIESLNILKDASATAVYGVKGANGVILITTRKGDIGAPHISYSGNFALQQSTALPSYLNSAQYAELYNEAGENDSRITGSTYIPRFTAEDIALYKNHEDPLLHPDTDWIGTFLRKFSTRTQHNVNVSGGIDKVKYFISGSFFDQTGIYKNTEIDRDHDVNPRDTRYNFRSNFDFQITRDFTAQVQLAAQIENIISPSGGNSSIWQAISFANPLSSPGLVDGKIVKIENGVGSVNPWQVLLSNGYNKRSSNNLNSSVRFDYDFSNAITKGLSAHVRAAYDSFYYSSRKFSKSFPYYLARREADGQEYLIPQSEASIWNTSTSWSKNRKVYFEGGINYDRTFGDHHVTALALYNQSKYWSPALAFYVPNAYQGLVGRLTYEYAQRYLLEFDMGYNGTENFAKGRRFGFFPAVSAGWIITEEPWLPKNDILTYMKIRASYGEVGNDKIGGSRFLYLPSSYGEASGSAYQYWFGVSSNPNQSTAVVEGKIGNPDLTWERARKANVGLDFNMFKGRLSVQSDAFYEYRDNILANRSTEPFIIGAELPAYNLGSMKNFGCEFDLTWRDKVKDFNYWVRGNFSFARNRIVFKDEVNKQYKYQAETGRRYGQFFGLIFDGYYNSWEEINALDRPVSAWNGNQLQPGDCRYVDVNKDGKIDNYDMVPLGYSNIPEIIYGVSCGFSWKGIDFSVLFQGATNVSIKYFGRSLWPFAKSEESAKSLILKRWTPERYAAGEDIEFPRLSLNPNSESDHNYRPSSLWIRDASYLRLKNIEIGYNFDRRVIEKLHVGGLRLFLNGSNLFTWSDVIDLDPEVLSTTGNTELNSYPLQKVYNIGLNITF